MKSWLLKSCLLMLGLVAASIVPGAPAQAQNYPWCAQYMGGDMGGAMNCGFVSFDQCMATVRGMGGFCMQNNTYLPPPGPHSSVRRRSPY
jgi:Protein of unknown function (DUF3551)